MFIDCFECPPISTNTYVVGCPETKKCAIIDPSMDSTFPVQAKIEKDRLIPTAIFLTHSHWDHIMEVKKIHQTYQIPVYCHRLDSENVENPGSDGLPSLHAIEGCKVDHFFEEGVEGFLGKMRYEILHTPGHSPGSVCIYFPAEKVLFSGDTLFQGTMGRMDLPTGKEEEMWDSLRKLSTLPPDTTVFPGHGPKTTIGEEKWIEKAKELFG